MAALLSRMRRRTRAAASSVGAGGRRRKASNAPMRLFELGLSRRRVTLDQMLECLISIRHPAADRYKAVLEAIGTVMAEGSPNAFASPPAPHAFRGSPSPEPAPRSGPHFPTSPAPRRSSHSIPTAGRRNLRRSTPHPDNAL